jgi:hypothetical protein
MEGLSYLQVRVGSAVSKEERKLLLPRRRTANLPEVNSKRPRYSPAS